MGTTATLATIADLEHHPGRCELINGEIIEMAPTGYHHGRSTSRIDRLLGQWADGKPFEVLTGEVGFIWDEHTVRAPDVAVITATQAARAPSRGFLPFAPILAVEVVSPNDAWADVMEKVNGWLSHGTPLVWVADPRNRSVMIATADLRQELDHTKTVTGDPVLPGFSCPVSRLFT